MKIIAITSSEVVAEDSCIIGQLVDKGIDAIHLRKPNADIDACRRLLSELTEEQRAKIVIHDFPELYFEYSLKGIHVNKNVATLPYGYSGFRTRSCHSFEEIARHKNDYDYLFLSPIFDSISKVGYKSGFSDEALAMASAAGIIDDKVVALGGVTFDKIAYLKKLNFGGAAMIGAIYGIDAMKHVRNVASYK